MRLEQLEWQGSFITHVIHKFLADGAARLSQGRSKHHYLLSVRGLLENSLNISPHFYALLKNAAQRTRTQRLQHNVALV